MLKEMEVCPMAYFEYQDILHLFKNKKVNGNSKPSNTFLTQNAIRVDGDYGFAPVAIKVGLPDLVKQQINMVLAF